MKRRDTEGWLFVALLFVLLFVRLSCGAGESRPLGYDPAPDEAGADDGRE
jgi:hypothetical protein